MKNRGYRANNLTWVFKAKVRGVPQKRPSCETSGANLAKEQTALFKPLISPLNIFT